MPQITAGVLFHVRFGKDQQSVDGLSGMLRIFVVETVQPAEKQRCQKHGQQHTQI